MLRKDGADPFDGVRGGTVGVVIVDGSGAEDTPDDVRLRPPHFPHHSREAEVVESLAI